MGSAPANIVEHLLFLFLLLVAPLWDYYDTRRLKTHPQSNRKIRYYQTLTVWLWVASAVAWLAVGPHVLFTINPLPDDPLWLFGHNWVRHLVEEVLAVFVLLLALPAVIAIWKTIAKKPRKWSSAKALKSLDFFFPTSWNERRWYAWLCITAGICEETLFRGFLLHYLHVSPWRLNLTYALLASSIIFGLQHLYLGMGGSIQAAVIGFLFALLFLLTGSLLLPMLLHAAMDLRMLLFLPPPGRSVAVTA